MGRKIREGKFLGFDGSLMNICDKVYDLFVLGILWIVCSLPLITMGAATAALYYAVVKCIKNNEGYAVKSFFHSFCQNFIPASVLWGIFAGMTFAMHLNIGILMHKSGGYVGLFFICFYGLVSVYLLIMACYAFPALSRFDMNAGWIFRLSMYMGVRYLLTSLALLLVLACMLALVWSIPMLVFLAPGPVIFLMSEFLERVLKKHEPKQN